MLPHANHPFAWQGGSAASAGTHDHSEAPPSQRFVPPPNFKGERPVEYRQAVSDPWWVRPDPETKP